MCSRSGQSRGFVFPEIWFDLYWGEPSTKAHHDKHKNTTQTETDKQIINQRPSRHLTCPFYLVLHLSLSCSPRSSPLLALFSLSLALFFSRLLSPLLSSYLCHTLAFTSSLLFFLLCILRYLHIFISCFLLSHSLSLSPSLFLSPLSSLSLSFYVCLSVSLFAFAVFIIYLSRPQWHEQ